MSGHRRKKGGHAEEHHVDERWLVSYADMITVLMALFIVLYAMSTVDQKKYDELKNSLATGFGVTKSEKVDQNKGVVAKQYVKKNGAGFSATTLSAAQEAKEIKKYLKSSGAKAQVSSTSTTVTVSLIGSQAYFGGNRANLRPDAIHVLEAIEPTLAKHEGAVTIEGHADPHGSAGSFGDDWNLAAARAKSVLLWILDAKAVDPADMSMISWGSENAEGTSAKALAKNRRVDIVLHQKAVTSQSTATEGTSDAEDSSSSHGSTESSSHGGESSHESASEETSSGH